MCSNGYVVLALLLCGLSTTTAITTGDFTNPGPRERPRFRYWIPDASVSADVVASDVRSADSIGAGGVEVLGYYNYGASFGPPPEGIDWAQTGWGLPAWKRIQDAAIEAAHSSGMVIDLTIGPNQGAGVPTNFTDPGRIWQLVAANVTVPAGEDYSGLLPGWGSGRLVAATSGLVLKNETVNLTSYPFMAGPSTVSGFQVTLAADSLTDWTSCVSADGQIAIKFSANATNGTFVLFGFYENQPLNYEQPPYNRSAITNYVQNGSWVVDHFSVAGAQTIINFWEQNLLNSSNKALLQQIGNYVWEDSQEYTGESSGITVLWTTNLTSHFTSTRGYSLQAFLPLILYGNNGFIGPLPYNTIYITEDTTLDKHVESDFRQSLTELNQEYLTTLSTWARTLGMQWSAQPGYNLPLDMLSTIPYVDVPETESLGFNDDLDWYRQFTGPAKLAGKRIVSSELGAQGGLTYAQTIPNILEHIKKSFVTSINAFVIHGLAWSGSYPSCTWPSYTTFLYLDSEMHGPHLPAWEYYGDWINYTARSSYVLQNSVPKYDVAFWLKNLSFIRLEDRYYPGDLSAAGYTYQYLSPDNFQLPAAVVEDETLAPDAQAFKALVVRANDTLTAPGVAKLQEYAQAGLPIFFSGGLPFTQMGRDPAGQRYINETINHLASLPNVYQVPYTGLAASLAQYNITPRATPKMNSTIFTHWSTNGTDYALIFNDAPGVSVGQGMAVGNITFQTSGNPYLYNVWTGSINALEVFSRSPDGNTITLPFVLAAQQTMIIGFCKDEPPRPSKIESTSSVFTISAISKDEYNVNVLTSPTSASLSLANGSTIVLPSFTAAPVSIHPWTLILESWSAPSDISDAAAPSVRTNTTYVISQLISWDRIVGSNTSVAGRGFYHANFTWPPSGSPTDLSSGAVLDLGYIYHTARVRLNDRQLPSLDVTRPQLDISPYLVEGTNNIDIVVPSPLSNTILPVKDQVHCYVNIASKPIQHTDNGLLMDIVITPYQTFNVDLQSTQSRSQTYQTVLDQMEPKRREQFPFLQPPVHY